MPNQFTPQDIQNIIAIIQAGSTKGLFNGPELSTVGQLWDKLNAMLADTQNAQQDQPET